MKLLRNKDFRRALLWHVIAGVLLMIGGFQVSPVSGTMLIAASIIFTVLYVIFTARRYRDIAAL
ncbi:MAG: sensor histidine kinase, partial [Clostridia bacterium]|nr:sensor histidine kinase [Clostridia bacterium]